MKNETEPTDRPNSSQELAYTQQWGHSSQRLKPGLYIVATPIGNLRDITLRALDVLQAADVVYCEDTRVTGRLLAAYGIDKKLERCDEHTEQRRSEEVIGTIRNGKIIAFVSDAGTPGISDPGAGLVAACHAANVLVSPIPGANAAIAAVSAAGAMQTGQFLFLGFLPPKSGARRKVFHAHVANDAILVLYEAAQRIADLLDDVAAILGQREVIVARELTKLHEQFYHGTPAELAQKIDHVNFKGEIVVLILPGAQAAAEWNEARIDAALKAQMQSQSLKQAVAEIASQSGMARKIIYARALALGQDDV